MSQKKIKTLLLLSLLLKSPTELMAQTTPSAATQEKKSEEIEAIDTSDLDLIEPSDAKILEDLKSDQEKVVENPEEKKAVDQGVDIDLSGAEEGDDLESLKADTKELAPVETTKDVFKADIQEEKKTLQPSTEIAVNEEEISQGEAFDVGDEEKELLKISKYLQNKIPDKEWNELAQNSKVDKYTVVEGDYLWKIAKKLFGSGFYYAKIWALNPYITNPHEIEPGMSLVFDTGSADSMPSLKIGHFDDEESLGRDGMKELSDTFERFGDDAKPPWLDEKRKLLKQGVYIQYASENTYEDLQKEMDASLNTEYEKYEPPETGIVVDGPGSTYDDKGFDKNDKIVYRFKEGFFLNTFLSSNIVQDFGFIHSAVEEKLFLSKHDRVYVKFDPQVSVNPGDMFSIYTAQGKVTHPSSERTGFKYTIVGQVKVVRAQEGLWECELVESTGVIQRSDRVTVYTPKIDKITKTFNLRNIEASLIGAFEELKQFVAFGDVVYLDRGRADGVELGNVFEAYGFQDRATERNITDSPTYKMGEVTIISLSDNFATGLVTNSHLDYGIGSIVMSKTKEEAARASKLKQKLNGKEQQRLEQKALDELDVELDLDDLNDDLLKKADKVQLSEDELAELERQERERSIIKDQERDLKALERLEKEIESAENMLKESKLDEDRLLEEQNLEQIEKGTRFGRPEESLDEIETQFGKKYLDEDLNSKENPYGLTEFDLEEIDELLNTDQQKAKLRK